jgi:hypothetical protein
MKAPGAEGRESPLLNFECHQIITGGKPLEACFDEYATGFLINVDQMTFL